MTDKKYHIDEFGQVVDDSENAGQLPEDKLSAERSQLHYEVFAHPERHAPDELAKMRARYDELSRQLGIKETRVSDVRDALRAGRAKIQQMSDARMLEIAKNNTNQNG